MTARTPTPPAVADELVAHQLRALDHALGVYRRRVVLAYVNPLDDRALSGLARTMTAATALERTTANIQQIQESTR